MKFYSSVRRLTWKWFRFQNVGHISVPVLCFEITQREKTKKKISDNLSAGVRTVRVTFLCKILKQFEFLIRYFLAWGNTGALYWDTMSVSSQYFMALLKFPVY